MLLEAATYPETRLSFESHPEAGLSWWEMECDPNYEEALFRFSSKPVSELLSQYDSQALQALRGPAPPMEVKSKSI
jgi:hypothetical protein